VISEVVIIDDTTYNVPVISLKRRADFLDKFAERTVDGKLHRELIGVFFNYQLQLGSTTDTDEYESLFDKLSEEKEFHTVTIPHKSGSSRTFSAYFSNVGDTLRRVKGDDVYWTGLTVNFIARSPTS
jgi:hypothetical protein